MIQFGNMITLEQKWDLLLHRERVRHILGSNKCNTGEYSRPRNKWASINWEAYFWGESICI